MGQIGINRMTTKLTPCVSSYYTETNMLHFKSCICVHPHHHEIIRTRQTRVTQYQWHIEGTALSGWQRQLHFNNQYKYWEWWKWLGITNLTVAIWYSRYVVVQYNVMLYAQYILSLELKKNSRHCHIEFIALKEIGNNKGGGHKWHALYGWLGARKTCYCA